MQDAFRRAKVPDEVTRIFGQKGEFFGKGQLTYAGVDILPKITGVEYAGAKALQKLHGAALRPIEALGGSKITRLFDPEKGYMKAFERQAKAAGKIQEQQFLKRYEDISAAYAPELKSRRQWLVRHIIDPDKAPTDAMWKTVTHTEQTWISELSRLFGEVQQSGVQAGYFKAGQIARNKATGLYFPRQYQKQWGWFADLPGARKPFLDK